MIVIIEIDQMETTRNKTTSFEIKNNLIYIVPHYLYSKVINVPCNIIC